ncbi:hypothetical protein I4U23_018602 [Adineta vaga]|nr:hypothetical protein I4U23_018602 [Adineta vaga]
MVENTISLLYTVKFWFLLILSVPSVSCSISIIIYFCRQKRTISHHHHLTLVLVILSLLQITTDILFSILFYRQGRVIITSAAFCTWWNWWEYSLNGFLLFIMAWSSVQRHMFVFRNAFLAIRWQRIVFHFFPFVIACAYPFLFYLSVIILNKCENQWDFNVVLCSVPCFMIEEPVMVTYDFVVNIVFPIMMITIANICLVFRVVRKRQYRQTTLRRQRKLTLQLLCFSTLFIIFWFPLTINGLFVTFLPSSFSMDIQTNYLFILVYMVPILIPFVVLPNLSNFIKTLFHKQQRSVGPSPFFQN